MVPDQFAHHPFLGCRESLVLALLVQGGQQEDVLGLRPTLSIVAGNCTAIGGISAQSPAMVHNAVRAARAGSLLPRRHTSFPLRASSFVPVVG